MSQLMIDAAGQLVPDDVPDVPGDARAEPLRLFEPVSAMPGQLELFNPDEKEKAA